MNSKLIEPAIILGGIGAVLEDSLGIEISEVLTEEEQALLGSFYDALDDDDTSYNDEAVESGKRLFREAFDNFRNLYEEVTPSDAEDEG